MSVSSEPPLRLTVRAVADVADPRVETTAAALAAQLDRLPFADPVRAAHNLHDIVGRLNRHPLEMGDRLQLLDLCGATSRRLTQLLYGLNRVSLDVHELRRQQTFGLQRLSAEFSYGYKQALLDARGPAKGGAERSLLAAALLRATRQLGNDLLLACAAYRPPATHLWSELTSIYLFAEYLGLETAQLAAPGCLTPKSSVTASYLQLLLLERHDPFRLPAGEVHKVYAYLDLHASLCHLTAVGDDPDRGAWITELPMGGTDDPQRRLVVIATLKQRLAEHVDALTNGVDPSHLELPPSLHNGTALATLRRMQRAWFARSERRSARHAQPGRVRVITGLAAICRDPDSVRPSPEPASDDDDQVIGKGLMPAFDHVVAPTPAIKTPWQLVNRSRGGLALQTPRGDGRGVSVGQLLGIESRSGTGSVLMTSAVRWLRFGNGEQLCVGVQHLAGGAVPVILRPIDDDGEPCRELQGLLVEQGDLVQLVADRGLLVANQLVDILGEPLRRVLVTDLVETTAAFDRYLIEPLD